MCSLNPNDAPWPASPVRTCHLKCCWKEWAARMCRSNWHHMQQHPRDATSLSFNKAGTGFVGGIWLLRRVCLGKISHLMTQHECGGKSAHSLAHGRTSAHFSAGNGEVEFRKRSETLAVLYLADVTAARSKEHSLKVLEQIKWKLAALCSFYKVVLMCRPWRSSMDQPDREASCRLLPT